MAGATEGWKGIRSVVKMDDKLGKKLVENLDNHLVGWKEFYWAVSSDNKSAT
jgi:hypothetical protein